MPDPTSQLETWIAAELAARFVVVIESMSGERPGHTCKAEPPDEWADALHWSEQEFNLGTEAIVWLGSEETTWKAVGQMLLAAAGIEDGGIDDLKSTYLEAVGQAFSGLAQSISERLRKEVTCTKKKEAAPGHFGYARFQIRIALGSNEAVLEAVIGDALIAAIQKQETEERAKAAPFPSKEKTDNPAASKSLDLLLDVELPVSVSFGRAQLPLKDALKLTTGSIVELNRAVSEPVEIIVNNCVIARGQVVVVEGNFGVRIQQVVSRQERLRTLK